MKNVEALEIEKLKVTCLKKLALGSAVDFDGAALIQFDDESSNEDGIHETGAVQVVAQVEAKGHGGISNSPQGYGVSYP